MKNIKTAIIFLSIVLALSSCSNQPKDMTSEIREAEKNFVKAFNSNDPKAMVQIYTKDAKLFPAGSEILEGSASVEKFWKGVFEAGISKNKITTNYAEGFGNTAIEEGLYTLYDTNNKILDEGKFIVIWKKEDGQWKYHRDIWNTNL